MPLTVAERQRRHRRKMLLEKADLYDFKARHTRQPVLQKLWHDRAETLRQQAERIQ